MGARATHRRDPGTTGNRERPVAWDSAPHLSFPAPRQSMSGRSAAAATHSSSAAARHRKGSLILRSRCPAPVLRRREESGAVYTRGGPAAGRHGRWQRARQATTNESLMYVRTGCARAGLQGGARLLAHAASCAHSVRTRRRTRQGPDRTALRRVSDPRESRPRTSRLCGHRPRLTASQREVARTCVPGGVFELMTWQGRDPAVCGRSGLLDL